MSVSLVLSSVVSLFNLAFAHAAIFGLFATVVLSTQLGAQEISLGVDGTISTVVGPTNIAPPNQSGYSGDGGPANLAMLDNPTGVAFDAAGNLYIADYLNNVVRKVNTAGVISTIVGNHSLGAGYTGDGGPATSAQLNQPSGLAFDKSGNLFIVDNKNNVIRKVDSSGIITTVAGNYSAGAGYSGDGGPATSSQLNLPLCIAFDSAGNLYISDTKNSVLRRVDANGVISTVAGNFKLGAGYSGDSRPATSAQLNYPAGLTFDSAGNLYITDQNNNVVRTVNTAGIISTFAGDGVGSYDGDGGPATSAGLSGPLSIVFDASGNAYIGDYGNQVVRKVDPLGIITSIAGYRIGSGAEFSSTYGPCYPNQFPEDYGDGGPASWACLGGPFGLAFDHSGNLYIADALNNSVREITMPSQSSVIFPPTKVGSSATLNITLTNISGSTFPISIPAVTLTSNTGEFSLSSPPTNGCPLTGSITFAPGGSCTLTAKFQPASAGLRAAPITIQVLSNTFEFQTYSLEGVGVGPMAALDSGIIFAVAGNVAQGFGYSGTGGPATQAQLALPFDVATDSAGNLYIYSYYGLVEKVDTHGFISTIAGGATQVCTAATDSVGDGCPATQATLSGGFAGIVVDVVGNIYISEGGGQRVRKVNASTGIITTVAGDGYVANGHGGYAGDGGPATSAELDFPGGLAVDAQGNLYITDQNNCVIRKVDTNGIITTVAGNYQKVQTFSGDGGPATAAGMNGPWSVKVDTSGNLYIADSGNSVIRKVNTQGTITTIAGVGGLGGYAGDGGAAASALLSWPTGIALDPAGDLYISDSGNEDIRKVDTSGNITTVAGSVAHICPHALDAIGDGCLATQGTFIPLTSGQVSDQGPNGMSVDTNGDLLIADAGDSVVREVTPATIMEFGPAPVSQSTTRTTFMFNTGNAPLQLSGSSTFGISGSNSADFTAVAGASQGCESGATIAPGSYCTIAVTFTPSAAGGRNAELAVSSNASNGASVTAALEGAGTIVSPANITLTTSSKAVFQGSTVTLTATVKPTPGTGTPTGSVTFNNGSTSLSTVLINSSGVATYSTSSLPKGTNSITASYEGDPYFSPSTSSAQTVTVGNTPTVTVTPSTSSITTAQTLAVTVSVSGGTGNPTPTGSVTVTSGSYTSSATALVSGGATINVPAGSLSTGNDTLTASYTPDSGSSSTYNNATGTASVTVTQAKTTPTVTVSPSPSNVTTAQSLTVTVTVGGTPTPTGSVTLTSGTYISSATAPTGGVATINVPAGSLSTGNDTLTASYTPDSASSSTYNGATGTASVTVITAVSPSFTVSGTAVTVSAPGATTGNTSTITVTPTGGFTGSVALTAVIATSPSGAQYPPTLSFGATSPVSITGTNAGTATLTISTTAPTSAALVYPKRPGVPWYAAGGATLACLLLFGIPARRRSWRTMLGMLFLLVAFGGGVLACGGGGSGGGGGGSGNPGTTAGAYTVTVTGTSGSLTQTTTLTVTVN